MKERWQDPTHTRWKWLFVNRWLWVWLRYTPHESVEITLERRLFASNKWGGMSTRLTLAERGHSQGCTCKALHSNKVLLTMLTTHHVFPLHLHSAGCSHDFALEFCSASPARWTIPHRGVIMEGSFIKAWCPLQGPSRSCLRIVIS